jgi:hypothetical protein
MRFVLAQDALINEPMVTANSALLMQLLEKYKRLVTVELPFSARAILAQSNIRVLGFGPTADLSVRIQMRRNWLRREIRSRDVIAGIRRRNSAALKGGLVIPEILRRGKDWLVEQQLPARHSDEADFRPFIEGMLPGFYELTVRPRPYRGAWGLPTLIADVQSVIPKLRVAAIAGLWPVALCHGDLSRSNVLHLTSGNLGLVDWETARVMGIAFDVSKPCIDMPAHTPAALRLVRQMTPPGGVPPELQLALAFAAEVRRQKVMPVGGPETAARKAALARDLMKAVLSGALAA